MNQNGISDQVKKFIIEHISSVEQLEVLLLLHKNAEKKGEAMAEWSADTISRELRIDPKSAAERLADLRSRGLLASRGSTPLYIYSPRSRDLEDTVNELSKIYREYRVTTINLIFSKPIDKVRTFADAFRLKQN